MGRLHFSNFAVIRIHREGQDEKGIHVDRCVFVKREQNYLAPFGNADRTEINWNILVYYICCIFGVIHGCVI